MLCAACRRQFDADFTVCPACRYPGLIDDKYRIDSIILDRGHSVTFGGTRVTDGMRVVLRKIVFFEPGAHEGLDRVRRYGAYIHQVVHPSLPVFLHEFPAQDPAGVAQWFVHSFVPGDSLARLLTRRMLSEPAVLRILAELGDLLGTLHRRTPPIVHRDIRPENIIQPAGSGPVVLTSFSLPLPMTEASDDADRAIAASLGYVAPEQLQGHVTPATDIYGAGATALRLLTKRAPGELSDRKGRLQTYRLKGLSAEMVGLLERMLHHDVDRRLPDGGALVAAIDETFLASGAPRPADAPAVGPISKWTAVTQPRMAAARPSPGTGRTTITDRIRGLYRKHIEPLPESVQGAVGLVALGVIIFTFASVASFLSDLDGSIAPWRTNRDCYVIGNLLTDPGLEYRTDTGLPTGPGQWSGDDTVIVRGRGQFQPAEGQAMLSFRATDTSGPSSQADSEVYQLVRLDAEQRSLIRSGHGILVACARFNRADGAGADTFFSLGLRGYAGDPGNFAELRSTNAHLVSRRSHLASDAAPETWQPLCVQADWTHDVQFLSLELAAHENTRNDLQAPEFVGHFADDICLAVISP